MTFRAIPPGRSRPPSAALPSVLPIFAVYLSASRRLIAGPAGAGGK
jgi:hypothetical protein